MVRLDQPQINADSPGLAVEITVLPLRKHAQHCVDLRIRSLAGSHTLLEMNSSVNPALLDAVLAWLEIAVTTRRDQLTEKFSSPLHGNLLVCIEQNRIAREDFIELQEQLGEDAFPYPFDYDLAVLVNPDPHNLLGAGLGLHFSSLGYGAITRFLYDLREEVQSAWVGEIGLFHPDAEKHASN
jgi:hypothetical protein